LDDNEGESGSLAALLGSDILRVSPVGPGDTVEATAERLAHALSDATANVLLLDYRLDDRADVEFRGGSVASAVKDLRPEVPVVLLTTDQKLHEWVETRPGVEELFDWRLLKGHITAEHTRDSVRAQVIDLARGWAELAAAASGDADPWDLLANVMGVRREEVDVFAQTELHTPRPEVPGALALWLLRGPLHWPGPLHGAADTRVFLGVQPEAFELDAVQTWLAPARYVGPFQSFGERWWSERVRSAVSELGAASPPDAEARARALSDHVGIVLPAEGCSWCGGLRTIRACNVCERGVDAAHSLRLLTEPPPVWADAPVLCFSCVADGSGEDLRLAPGSEDIVDGLKDGSISPPSQTDVS
jgi:hypothetical protein